MSMHRHLNENEKSKSTGELKLSNQMDLRAVDLDLEEKQLKTARMVQQHRNSEKALRLLTQQDYQPSKEVLKQLDDKIDALVDVEMWVNNISLKDQLSANDGDSESSEEESSFDSNERTAESSGSSAGTSSDSKRSNKHHHRNLFYDQQKQIRMLQEDVKKVLDRNHRLEARNKMLQELLSIVLDGKNDRKSFDSRSLGLGSER